MGKWASGEIFVVMTMNRQIKIVTQLDEKFGDGYHSNFLGCMRTRRGAIDKKYRADHFRYKWRTLVCEWLHRHRVKLFYDCYYAAICNDSNRYSPDDESVWGDFPLFIHIDSSKVIR